ncbi:methyl coenzyme M reductase system, component A2 [Methanospirillum lacunae]|uniref:Methyl coenzyme M reductase system, component A2 n=1 Tax=Methanospirillum lacunae TaxID=668570 RepID=A0A2V2N245_9EURY|nr:methyl coenzyme M reductase system, component A2 [Methanospirillum lacunae]PWR70598.1 methyl coenzyme M reductase system, component A2 [Methanospirillum lacunae]
MRPLITVENLSMVFDGKTVIKDLSFTLAEGEILGIIGRSGAGKTVLMHLLRGVDQPPTGGRVLYHIAACDGCEYVTIGSHEGTACPRCGALLKSIDVDFWNPDNEGMKRRIMLRNAIMFQRTFALYGNDRVIDNVLKALDDVSFPSHKAVSRAADLVDQVRLSHRMMHIARDLSGGEKQRVVLARQLAKEPFCLFADEPTGTLDPKTASIVHQVLKESAEETGMAMVVTSHFSQILEDIVHRAILLDDGAIKAIGTPAEVTEVFMQGYHDDEQFGAIEVGEEIMRARELSKRYVSLDRGLIRAVDLVDLSVNRKEILGIIGTSGAGKTTLSKMIAGILEPTSGDLIAKVGDEWVDMTKPGFEFRGRAKQYIGLLHQEYDLFPHRTVLDNLTDAIGLEFPKELAMRKAIITLKMAGFTTEKSKEILERLPGTLSEGERHRVALAQVLIREPHVVVLDEPTGTMDLITKVDVKHSIMHSREEMEETFIIVSHDMDFVRDTCDRCALMRFGKIVKVGPTAEVLAEVTEQERQTMAAE